MVQMCMHARIVLVSVLGYLVPFRPQLRLLSGHALPKRVKIVEVGPRDGLQNEKVQEYDD